MMAPTIGTRGPRALIFAILFCAFAGNLSSSDRITINVHQSDAAIRQQLLDLTPPGTPIQEVYHFLQSRLQRDRDSRIAGWPVKRAGAFMSVELGHYFEARGLSEGLFMFPTVVQAFWDFDKDNKLRDIRVRRFVRGW
jgi:hypothetical protein